LKVAGGDVPSAIKVANITKNWNFQTLTVSNALETGNDNARIVPVVYSDGWVTLDITDYVKDWMSGKRYINGLALYPVDGGGIVNFVKTGDGVLEVPYITIEGTVCERPTGYAAFGFGHKTPADDLAYHDNDDTVGSGNCMSFALRDTNPIQQEHLGYESTDLDREYAAGGEAAVLEFIVGLMESYVAEHGESLKVSSFRRIEAYNSPIEPDEYRIATRIAILLTEFIPLFNDRNFDFHFWAQIDDGRWSQKFPSNYSEIIPGTAYDIDPVDCSWHSARQWGNDRWHNVYSSDIVYFAVTKDTAEFTSHVR